VLTVTRESLQIKLVLGESGTTLAAAQRDSRSAAWTAYDATVTGHPSGAHGVLDLLEGWPGGIHACPPPGCVTEARMLQQQVPRQAPSYLAGIDLAWIMRGSYREEVAKINILAFWLATPR
jgi:hypothetical protein